MNLYPQKKGLVIFVKIKTPRKPNSAKRIVCKSLIFLKKYINSSILGGQSMLKKHNLVLIAGRGAQDVPGVHTHCVRNKYDLLPPSRSKKKKRSIYGISK